MPSSLLSERKTDSLGTCRCTNWKARPAAVLAASKRISNWTREGRLRRMARSFLSKRARRLRRMAVSLACLHSWPTHRVPRPAQTVSPPLTLNPSARVDPAISFHTVGSCLSGFPPDRKSPGLALAPPAKSLRSEFPDPSPTSVLLFHKSSRSCPENRGACCDHWYCPSSLRRPTGNQSGVITSAITTCKQSVRLSRL